MADTQQDYREPTEQERESLCSGSPEWIGKEIDVFWDGDNVYYPAVIVRVADGPHKITVQYENTEGEFDEDLSATPWRIWASAQPRPKADPVKVSHCYRFSGRAISSMDTGPAATSSSITLQ